jgi:hypothetical protein
VETEVPCLGSGGLQAGSFLRHLMGVLVGELVFGAFGV